MRVARVITRLNIGGPAVQALDLSRQLASRGIETCLIHGRLASGEGDITEWEPVTAAQTAYVEHLVRPVSPQSDLRAFWAIYKALLEQSDDRQKALAEVDILFRAAFFPAMMRGIRVLNYLPDPFPIVRPVLKMMTRDEYLPGAQEIVEDGADCFALNVYRCLILDTLAEHHAQELTASFCSTDDWLAELMPKISWERTKTLGRGGDCCDFRWCRIG
jgi:hypothetical protein